MTPRKIVQNFYKSDVVLDPASTSSFLHPEVVVEWHSSKGFLKVGHAELVALADELSRAYVQSKIRISHLLADGNMVTVRYSHYVQTIENPREEMLLAHFIVIWEVRDGKLFRGYQMSQLS